METFEFKRYSEQDMSSIFQMVRSAYLGGQHRTIKLPGDIQRRSLRYFHEINRTDVRHRSKAFLKGANFYRLRPTKKLNRANRRRIAA